MLRKVFLKLLFYTLLTAAIITTDWCYIFYTDILYGYGILKGMTQSILYNHLGHSLRFPILNVKCSELQKAIF